MNQPLVCVCIPCYNAEATIVETLESIQKQTYHDFEIHIFDNASTDNTIKLIHQLDENIQIHQAKETTTGEENFTRCLNFGGGKYTAIYHADDLYGPEMLGKQVAFLEVNRGAGGVLTFANIINENSQKVRAVYAPSCLSMKTGEWGAFELIDLVKAVLKENNFFFCPSAMIRTKVCTEVLKEWRGNMFGPGADLDVWFRISEAGSLGLINEPLLQYRVTTSHFSHGYNKQNTKRADLFAILDHWMNKERVAVCLDEGDQSRYQTWLMWDDVSRARNALNKKEVRLARELFADVHFLSILKGSIGSLRGFKFLMLASYVMLQLWLK